MNEPDRSSSHSWQILFMMRMKFYWNWLSNSADSFLLSGKFWVKKFYYCIYNLVFSNFLISLFSGATFAHLLLVPLESLAAVEETVVRDAAVESLKMVAEEMAAENVESHFMPLVKRLAQGEWSVLFTWKLRNTFTEYIIRNTTN